MSVKSSRVSLVASAAALVIGCNPYDPDLGSQPFLCGFKEPRCPDGYVCVDHSTTDHVCEREDVAADAGGDGVLPCGADAMLEPNESIDDPTIVPIPDLGETYMVAGVMCHETDRDVFRLNIDVTGKNARIEVSYDSSQGPLAVNLLNSTGISIRAATPTGGDPDKLRADFANLAQGTYFGQVESTGTRAGYEITFIATAGALPP